MTAPTPAMAPPLRLVPVDDDPDTGGFFAAAREGRLVVRRCNGCDAVLHLPRAYCSRCGGWDGRWQDVAGTGSVHSWTVVDHQVHPGFPVPYTIVLVDVDLDVDPAVDGVPPADGDGPAVRMVGHLHGAPDLVAGQRLRVRFDCVADDVVVPGWEPVDQNSS
jgi:uncharacterized protein